MSRGLKWTEQQLAELPKSTKVHVDKPVPDPTTQETKPSSFLIAKVSPATNKVGTFRPLTGVKPPKTRKSAPKAPVPTEHAEQCAVIAWCDQHPIAKHIMAIPNGAYKGPASAAKFKREGLRAGVPDLFLPVARGQFFGMFIEMKRSKGGVVTVEQRERLDQLDKAGYFVYIAKGADKAIDMIQWYLEK